MRWRSARNSSFWVGLIPSKASIELLQFFVEVVAGTPDVSVIVIIGRVVVDDGLTTVPFHDVHERMGVEHIELAFVIIEVGMVKLRKIPEPVDLAGVVGDGNVLPIHLDDEVHSSPLCKVLFGE